MSAIDHLLSLLDDQRQVCCRLLELVREEQVCLVDRRYDRLDAIITEQIALLTKRRRYAVRIAYEWARLAAALHLDRHASLATIAINLPPAIAPQLVVRYRELAMLTVKLQCEGNAVCSIAKRTVERDTVARHLSRRAGTASLTARPSTPVRRRAARRVMVEHCA